jgi:hypothetical protein
MFTGKDVGPLSDTEHNMIPDRKSNRVRIEAQLLHRVCSESIYPLGTCLPSRLQAKTEDILAHHLDVRRRHGDVLGGDVHVAEAAFEAAARVGRGRPGGVEHQVHGLCSTLGRVGARQTAARPEVITECLAPGRAVGQRAHGLVEERAAGTQQSLGAAYPLVRRVLGREGARGQRWGLGPGQGREGVDRIARDAERDRGPA